MIAVTDEMVQLALDTFLATPTETIGQIDDGMRQALTAVLAIVERQQQEAYGEAYQRGWRRGQHQLCPRCGVELAREVAAEQQDPQRRECGADGPDGAWCEREPGHSQLHGRVSDEGLVLW